VSCSKSNGNGQKPILDLTLGIASKTTTNPPGGLVVSAQKGTAPSTGTWPNYLSQWFLVLKGDSNSTDTNILPAPDCTKAAYLLSKKPMDGSISYRPSDPLFNMTAQLLGAELNRFAGAAVPTNAGTVVDQAVWLNGKYHFNGVTYWPALTPQDYMLARCLATQLDNYNNNLTVGTCP
jgi:hypothetical protein